MQPNLSSSEKTDSIKYMQQLDGLRAIAILIVLYTHYSPKEFHPFEIDLGAYAVRLFFVLSGFLITGILLKCREISKSKKLFVLRQFYIRRFMRIFPIFYVTLAVGLVLNVPDLKETIFWHVTYLSNIYFTLQNNWFGFVGPFWSLAVEEQFYLIWPWTIMLVPRKLMLPAIFSLIFLGPIFRLIGIIFNLNQVFIYGSTPVVLDTLGFGSLLAYLHYYRKNNTISSIPTATIVKTCFLVGLPLLTFILTLNRIRYDQILDVVFRDTALGLIFIWVVFRAAKGFSGMTGRVLESPLVMYLGKISYGMYVVHLFVAYAVDKSFNYIFGNEAYNSSYTWAIIALLSTITTVLVAMISWHFLEKPINDLKRFFPYTPKTL